MRLNLSRHAVEAAASDRYGQITLPVAITFGGKDIIEAEVLEGGRVTKIVVRLRYNAEFDCCYAIGEGGPLKTVWLNRADDTHSTLNRSRYRPK